MHVKPILKERHATGMIMKAINRSFHLDLTQIYLTLAEMLGDARALKRNLRFLAFVTPGIPLGSLKKKFGQYTNVMLYYIDL